MSAHKYNWAGYCIYCQCANHSIRADQSCPAAPSMQPAPATEQASDDENEWRRLALQFDGHRMHALGHLKALLQDPVTHAAAATRFLSAGPLSGEAVLAERIAALATQAERVQDRPLAMSNAEAAQWARANGLNVPPEWEGQAERVQSSESIDTPEFRVIIDDYEHHRGASKKSAYRAIVAHIDARRATASKAEAPVAWLESEPSTRNLPIFDVLNSNCHTTIWHTRRAPVTDNPVWTVYGPSLAATTKQGTP